jgi:hypothetical protein
MTAMHADSFVEQFDCRQRAAAQRECEPEWRAVGNCRVGTIPADGRSVALYQGRLEIDPAEVHVDANRRSQRADHAGSNISAAKRRRPRCAIPGTGQQQGSDQSRPLP